MEVHSGVNEAPMGAALPPPPSAFALVSLILRKSHTCWESSHSHSARGDTNAVASVMVSWGICEVGDAVEPHIVAPTRAQSDNVSR